VSGRRVAGAARGDADVTGYATSLAYWLVVAAVAGVAGLVALYAVAVVATLLGTLIAMVVAGLRAWLVTRR
jgi:ABC-type maltose transport system permease subunit